MDNDAFNSSESSDDERIAISDELKALSFEELLKLKEKFGTKNYNNKVFKRDKPNHSSSEDCDGKTKKKEMFNRTNKNRPREESSKVPVKSMFNVSNKSRQVQARDPRFDSLSGEFNEAAFMKNYSFIDDIKEKELKKLQILYKREKDPEEKTRIKAALQRLKNQKRSQQQRQSRMLEKQSEREKNLQLIKEGKNPRFKRKGEEKALKLIDKYEKLKADGKLEKYVKKKSKEQSRKSSFKKYFQ